jgi:hypothetical protein
MLFIMKIVVIASVFVMISILGYTIPLETYQAKNCLNFWDEKDKSHLHLILGQKISDIKTEDRNFGLQPGCDPLPTYRQYIL